MQGRNFPIGTPVEVRDQFRRLWTRGFEVSETDDNWCRLRRLSDRHVLPGQFASHDIRRAD
jgi:hypothetical protein